ncbi:hypothetical protein COOONC_03384 [Cooperia oncophora]
MFAIFRQRRCQGEIEAGREEMGKDLERRIGQSEGRSCP